MWVGWELAACCSQKPKLVCRMGQGMFPWPLPPTDHPVPPTLLDRYNQHRIAFSTSVSQEFEDKQPYQLITRQKLCFTNHTRVSLHGQCAACVTSGHTPQMMKQMRPSTPDSFGFCCYFIISP